MKKKKTKEGFPVVGGAEKRYSSSLGASKTCRVWMEPRPERSENTITLTTYAQSRSRPHSHLTLGGVKVGPTYKERKRHCGVSDEEIASANLKRIGPRE